MRTTPVCRVYLHLADIGACGKGEVHRVVEGGLVQAELVQRVVVRHIGRQRHLGRDFFVRALHRELAAGKLDVGVARLHRWRFLGLGLDLVQRLHDGRAAHAQATCRRCPCRRAGAPVAVHDVHLVLAHTPRRAATSWANVVSCPWPWLCEPVNTVTLPGCTRTSPASNSPARPPGRRRCCWAPGWSLDVAAVAHAALEAPGLAGLAARGEARHVGQVLLRLVHAGVVVANVVLQRHRRLIGEKW